MNEFIKNSEKYISGNYSNDAPNIDINNLNVNIGTFIFDKRS